MPGAMRSGRREPVRGVASFSQGGESHTSSNGQPAEGTPPAASMGQDSRGDYRRPTGLMSSGQPAAAALVPIIRHQHVEESLLLPPSPPSTPPSSPPPVHRNFLVQARQLSLSDEGQRTDGQQIELNERLSRRQQGTAFSSSANSVEDALLKAAAASVATSRADVDASQDASGASTSSQALTCARERKFDPSQQRADSQGTGPGRGCPSQPLMPNTPETTPTTMSPAEGLLRHQPTASAFELLQSIYPLLPSASSPLGAAQDAGVELVCSKWKGAVLDEDGGTGTTSSRTLHVLMPKDIRAGGPLRDEILALLDLASERLACGRVVIAMERSEMEDFSTTLHGLCYVGAQVVSDAGHALLVPRDGIILAGIDLL